MKNKLKSIFKVCFVIIGTIIGAGFASGKEINLFFNTYRWWGIVGFIINCIFFSIIIYKVFNISKILKISNYSEFLKSVNPKYSKFMKITISLFLIVSFYIMIAGMGAYFKQQFGISQWITSIIMSFICYIILQKNINGIISLNNLLVPFIILFIIFLGMKNIGFTMNQIKYAKILEFQSMNFFFSSILYASYNSLILIPILVELQEKINSNKENIMVSLICLIILLALGLSIIFLLESGGKCLKNIELPMLEIVKKFGKVNQYLYGIVMVIAILTSAIASGYSFSNNSKGKAYSYKIKLFVMCSLAPLISQIGFSKLIEFLYPIFGILGLWQIYNIFSYTIRNDKIKSIEKKL